MIYQLNSQKAVIRRQLILLLLNGHYSADIDTHMRDSGIKLDGECFSVLTLMMPSPDKAGILSDMIEDLSDEIIHFYVAQLREAGHLAIVLCFPATRDIGEITEKIGELAKALGIHIRVSSGFICQNPKQLQSSLLVALSGESMGKDALTRQIGANRAKNWYNDSDLEHMMAAMENGNIEKAYLHLRIFALAIEREYTSILIKKCIYVDVLNRIMRKAHEINVDVANKEISEILLTEDSKLFIDKVSALISEMCVAPLKLPDNKPRNDKMLEYINEHFLDYNMSLSWISEIFNLSSKQTSRIIREMTGMHFNEYITQQKIEKAKFLLIEEGLTVTQVSQALNYSSIPYFIKIFREITGITPSKYKNILFQGVPEQSSLVR